LKKTAYHIIFFLFAAYNCIAQTSTQFENITSANGLPSNYVFCVAEDIIGSMWAGTDKGLCRYNGAVWEVWDTDKGLPGNYVYQILPSTDGGLWIGISEKGLYYFETATKKVYSCNIIAWPSYYVSSFKNMLVVESYDSLAVLQFNNTDKKIIATKKPKVVSVDGKAISHYDAATDSYTYFHSISGASLLQPQKQGRDIHYYISNANGNNFKHRRLCKGITQLDNTLILEHTNPVRQIDLSTVYKKTDRIVNATVLNDKVYVSNYEEGMLVIDKAGNMQLITEADGLAANTVNNVYATKDSIIYISTLGGGISVIPKEPRYKIPFNNQSVLQLQHSNNAYYALAGNNIFKFTNSGVATTIPMQYAPLSFFVQQDTLLVGSFSGLHFYKLINQDAKLLYTISIGAGISAILPYKNTWLITTYGSGCQLVKNNELQKVEMAGNVPFNNIERTLPVNNGFAMLSFEDGFYTCNENLQLQQHYTAKNGLVSNFVNAVATQHDTIWAGGKNGVTVLHNNKVIKTFTAANGFKGSVVTGIFFTTDNIPIIISNTYIHIAKNNSLLPVKNVGMGNTAAAGNAHCALLHNNNFIVGGDMGVAITALYDVFENSNIPAPVLEKVIADTDTVSIDDKSILSAAIKEIIFYCRPLSNLLYKRTQLQYRLNDDEWKTINDSLKISFTNLRPGNYTLWLKAINSDGKESIAVAAKLFTINKAWWLQWWFFISCFIATLVSWWQLFRLLSKRRMKRQQQLQLQLENERQRISRDLHDNMGAYTSALIANVQQLKGKTGETEDTKKMQQNAESILSSLRETIWVLNNKEIKLQDFSDNFKAYCIKLLSNFEHVSFNAEESIEKNETLSAATAIHLNKMLQEVIQNIIKHAAATVITYTITDKSGISISIADNGKGFDATAALKGNGIDNMKWRGLEAGFVVLVSTAPGNGTSITLHKQ
jgi:signal transduction histidine kinase